MEAEPSHAEVGGPAIRHRVAPDHFRQRGVEGGVEYRHIGTAAQRSPTAPTTRTATGLWSGASGPQRLQVGEDGVVHHDWPP